MAGGRDWRREADQFTLFQTRAELSSYDESVIIFEIIMKGRHDFFASPGKSAAAGDPQARPGRTGVPIAGPFGDPSQLATFAEIHSEYFRFRGAKKESVFTAKTGDAEKIKALKKIWTQE